MDVFQLDQVDVHGRIAAGSYFSDIPVFLVRPRGQLGFAEIQQQVDAALAGVVRKAGKSGAAVQVLMPVADGTDFDAPGARFVPAITVRVQELVIPNMGPSGTQKPCEEIALNVAQLVHHFNPGRGYVFTIAQNFWTPRDTFAPKLTIDLAFDHQGGIAAPDKVARPTIAAASFVTGQNLTLACVTTGAAIFYTTDGSYPSSNNPDSTRYQSAFSLASACTLRFAAEKSGKVQSDVVQQAISAA